MYEAISAFITAAGLVALGYWSGWSDAMRATGHKGWSIIRRRTNNATPQPDTKPR